MENNQDVVFYEGEIELKPGSETTGGFGKEDRIVRLIKKISGGRIKSDKIATTIALILVGIMITLALVWIF